MFYTNYKINFHQKYLLNQIEKIKQEKVLLQIELNNYQEKLKKSKSDFNICLYEKDLISKKNSFISNIINPQKDSVDSEIINITKIYEESNSFKKYNITIE